jgi:formylmethanofuran dehydrogenase subunit B
MELASDSLRPVRGACERSRIAFAQLGAAEVTQTSARVNGERVAHEAAVDDAAQILRNARRPLIGGLAIDIDGMRAALALARRVGAVMDHAVSSAKYRNLHVLQEAGWISTTLAEVKNRADLLMLVGDGWHTRFPRFVERVIAPDPQLFAQPLARRIVLVDRQAGAVAHTLPQRFQRLQLDATIAQVPELFAILSALASGAPVDATRLPGIAATQLEQCIAWLRGSQYGTVVWAAPDLDVAHAELALQMLARLIRTLNREGRFAALPLAGSNGDLTANAVHTWQSGVAFPANYANGRIDFDPHRYHAANVLARGEPDCLVWISSLSAELTPPEFDGPAIVLGRADMQPPRSARVFIPVATPGVDAPGALIRTDKVVSLYLQQLRTSALPSVADTLRAIERRMQPA